MTLVKKKIMYINYYGVATAVVVVQYPFITI